MGPILLAVVFGWLFMRGWEAVRAEWVHTRDSARADLKREHPGWSDGRLRRNARSRSRSYWWQEISNGLPTFRSAWAKHRLAAQIQLEEGRAAGERGIRQLRERLEKARQDRIEAGETEGGTGEDTESSAGTPVPALVPEIPDDGTPPPLTVLPGGKDADSAGGTPPPAVPDEIPVPEFPVPASGDSWWLNPAERRCEGCGGQGSDPADPGSTCPACRGWGNAPADPGSPEAPEGTICNACGNASRPGDPVLATPAASIHRSHALEHQETYTAALQRMRTSPALESNGQHPATQPEGDPVTADTSTVDVEQGETPFEGLQLVLGKQAQYARATADHAQDQLIAYAVTHGFDRDPEVMAQLQAIHDAAEAHANAAEGAQRTLVANHTEGAEYHGNGRDAHASAFRPA